MGYKKTDINPDQLPDDYESDENRDSFFQTVKDEFEEDKHKMPYPSSLFAKKDGSLNPEELLNFIQANIDILGNAELLNDLFLIEGPIKTRIFLDFLNEAKRYILTKEG